MEEVYDGHREIGDGGVVLFVNGRAMQYVVIKVEVTGHGMNFVIICDPEYEIKKGSHIRIVWRLGGFVMLDARYDDGSLIDVVYQSPPHSQSDVDIPDSPVDVKSDIVRKLEKAKVDLGIEDEQDF